ncbi:MAG TPA: GNAT family N-acetyltransferase [Pelobium sp.]|nr:GNAT family N-acetyltransferase [Pelobium sp.]
MNYSIFIRPLALGDGQTSYKWRNDELIWEFTEFKPNKPVTVALETEWIKKALAIKNDHRFAICIKETGQYIGNVQLVNVKDKSADFHLFIGDSSFWGKGIGQEATRLVLYYAFNLLNLYDVMLKVHRKHIAAKKLYEKMGFQVINDKGVFIQMILTKKYYKALVKTRGIDIANAHEAVLLDNYNEL